MSEKIESQHIETFTKKDDESTVLAQKELVEPSGISPIRRKDIPLIDDNEQMLLVTDTNELLRFLTRKHNHALEVISQATEEPYVGRVPLSSHEVLIGKADSPSGWVRYAPTKSNDPQNLAVFLNIDQKEPVLGGMGPQGEMTVYSYTEFENLPPEIHRRSAPTGKRQLDPKFIVEFDVEKLNEDGFNVWMVTKNT